MKLIINDNDYNKNPAQYVLSDANSCEVIAIIKASHKEDIKEKVLQALIEHHDEEHTEVYNVQVFDSMNTKFDSDGDNGTEDEPEIIDRNYNLIRTTYYE